ncbi:AhpC/TSA family protein [Natronincola peptidivorans]|uniref:AhpC/TSA family protein n=3 Tax=Natronincola peptidivorans TaxID=426128 RepID=A0A1I0GAZ5_9FIRM|nr:AhpC/TSA family protein [Natronincola peptidivorans]
MPQLDEFHQANKNNNTVVIAVSLLEDEKIVNTFVEKGDYSFPVLMDKTAESGFEYKVRFTPTTYLINTEGKIIDIIVGPLDFQQIYDRFQALE